MPKCRDDEQVVPRLLHDTNAVRAGNGEIQSNSGGESLAVVFLLLLLSPATGHGLGHECNFCAPLRYRAALRSRSVWDSRIDRSGKDESRAFQEGS